MKTRAACCVVPVCRWPHISYHLYTCTDVQLPLSIFIFVPDVPLSYGVYDVVNAPSKVHFCEFLWDPTKETGVFVRLNCISTEFTPKKHGGEKGVPFRIVIETFSHGEPGPPQKLHSASCQVKVFKPKGADRKHKTDREKMLKRPQSEQEKHQPSYDCTVFTECPLEPVFAPASPPLGAGGSSGGSGDGSSPSAVAVGAVGASAAPVVPVVPTVPLVPPTGAPAKVAANVMPPASCSPPQPQPQPRSGSSSYSPQGSSDALPPVTLPSHDQ